jgi:hypothetical protein
MLVTPADTSRSHIIWAAPAGTAITPIATPCALDHHAAELAADQRRVGVEDSFDAEPAGEEPAVVRQGAAEVTGADDDDRPALGQPEGTGDLVDQVLHVVADPPDAVRAEVAEVLAELG